MVQQNTNSLYEGKLKILLTKREKEVLKYLAQGYTDIEIGKEIHLSQSTIKTYRKNLLRKYNARHSCHLIFLAVKDSVI